MTVDEPPQLHKWMVCHLLVKELWVPDSVIYKDFLDRGTRAIISVGIIPYISRRIKEIQVSDIAQNTCK